MKKAHTHALWIYGVIVGLAIREALTHVMPFVIGNSNQLHPEPVPTPRQMILMGFRLVVFLAMIVRFYFGSALYFTEMYDPSDQERKRREGSGWKQSFGMDFLFGLAHFLIFFGWSYTITVFARGNHGLNWFLWLLIVVLSYDVFWLLASIRYDTATYIALWTLLNVGTAAIWFFVFVASGWLWSPDTAEEISFIPVGLVAIIDFADMISGKNLVTAGLRKIIKAREIETSDPASAPS